MELKKYEKDSYIVLLPGFGTFAGWDDIPFFHCYQLNEESNLLSFSIYKDLEEDLNGFSDLNMGLVRLGQPGETFSLREATKQEIHHYQLLGKPYDVRYLPEANYEEEDLTYLVKMINNLKINAK